MTREQIVRKLRELTGNQFFLAQDLDNDEGFHVSNYDLESIKNQKELKALIKAVKCGVTDKGLWFYC